MTKCGAHPLSAVTTRHKIPDWQDCGHATVRWVRPQGGRRTPGLFPANNRNVKRGSRGAAVPSSPVRADSFGGAQHGCQEARRQACEEGRAQEEITAATSVWVLPSGKPAPRNVGGPVRVGAGASVRPTAATPACLLPLSSLRARCKRAQRRAAGSGSIRPSQADQPPLLRPDCTGIRPAPLAPSGHPRAGMQIVPLPGGGLSFPWHPPQAGRRIGRRTFRDSARATETPSPSRVYSSHRHEADQRRRGLHATVASEVYD